MLLCVRILAQEGDIWREAGEYAEAARTYRSALSLCPAASSCPDHPDLLLSLGSTLHALGSLAAAAEVYQLCQRYTHTALWHHNYPAVHQLVGRAFVYLCTF